MTWLRDALFSCGVCVVFLQVFFLRGASVFQLAALLLKKQFDSPGQLVAETSDVEGIVDLCHNTLQTPRELYIGL